MIDLPCARAVVRRIHSSLPKPPWAAQAAASTSTSTSALAHEAEPALQQSIRTLFRRTAQPVALLTTRRSPTTSSATPAYHGATLSSFTSISLAPLPLVAFSLRLPSRAAQAIDNAFSAGLYPKPSLVVNLLSAEQADLARHFSRPDLYPDPWSMHAFDLSEEGVPIFPGSLGALSCAPVTSFPLDWTGLRKLGVNVSPGMVEEVKENTSELFLAQVVRVELESRFDKHPLLYQERVFKTVAEGSLEEGEPKKPAP